MLARRIAAFLGLLLVVPATATADPLWNTFNGEEGPGKGKKIVLISGDEEYRSEEALTQLGQILSKHHGFDCVVLYAIDPKTGTVDSNNGGNIPGTDQLNDADLMVIFTRFRHLPDEQMQPIDDFLRAGKPVIGLRTATHAFNGGEAKWKHYSNGYNGDKTEWKGGFGRLVLGEKWISHHGHHKHESTRGMVAPKAEDHPIMRGIDDGDIWGSTDVYGVRLPLPGDSKPLVLGAVVKRDGEFDPNDPDFGMRPTDKVLNEKKNDPMMPIAWVKSYQIPGGEKGQAFTSTVGASVDLNSEGVRRLLVNATYHLVGLSEQIPAEGTQVDLVGKYEPTAFSFLRGDYWTKRAVRPADFISKD